MSCMCFYEYIVAPFLQLVGVERHALYTELFSFGVSAASLRAC